MKTLVNFYLNFLSRKYLLLNQFFHSMEIAFLKQMVAMQVDFHLRAIPAQSNATDFRCHEECF